MAGFSHPVYLWDKSHEGGQLAVSQNDSVHKILLEKTTEYTNVLQLSEDFLAKALQRDVIDQNFLLALEEDPTHEIKVLSLMRHVLRGRMYQFHGFLWALTNTQQFDLVRNLKYDPIYYIDRKLYLETSEFKCPACKNYFHTKAYVLWACGHYICVACTKAIMPERVQAGENTSALEKITCPVEDCEKKTEVLSLADQDLSLECDNAFEELARLMKQAEDTNKDQCSICKLDLSQSPVKHYCTDCEKTLCSPCYFKHQQEQTTKGHASVHQHHPCICCAHGFETTKYCQVCKFYVCESCEKANCDHLKKFVGVEEDVGLTRLRQTLDKFQKDSQENIASCKKSWDEFSVHEREAKQHVQHQRKRIKEWADDWAGQLLRQIDTAKQEMNTRITQVEKWQKAVEEMNLVISGSPWLFTDLSPDLNQVLSQAPSSLSQETDACIKSISSPTALLRDMMPPNFCAIPPTTATFLMEWQAPASGILGLEWTDEGDLIVAQFSSKMLSKLKVDVAGKKIVHQKLDDIHQPTDVTCCPNGNVYVSNKEGSIMIYKKGADGPEEWKPKDIEKPWCITCNDHFIFISEADDGAVLAYDLHSRDWVSNGVVCDSPGLYRLHALNDRLVATSSSNELLVFKLQECSASSSDQANRKSVPAQQVKLHGTTEELESGAHARGVGVYMNRYILVCDPRGKGTLAVHSLDGEFVGNVSLESEMENPWALAVYHVKGQKPLLAIGSYQTLKIYELE